MRARATAFDTLAKAMEYFRKEVPRYLKKEHKRNNNEWDRNEGGEGVGGDVNTINNENCNYNKNGNNNANANKNGNENNSTDGSSWPPSFSLLHLPLINWNKVIFVDEKHLHQKVGGDGALDMMWTFLEDNEGNLDVDNGKEDKQPCELQTKYEKERQYTFACVAEAEDG